MTERITNAEFAKSNKNFNMACTNCNAMPTTRQASKWRNKKGAARKGIMVDIKVYNKPKNGG